LRVLHSFPTRRSSDLWFRPPVLEVRMADCPVISVSRAAVGESMRHGAFLARKFMISRQTVKGSSKVQQRRGRNSSPHAGLQPRRSEEHTSELQSQSNL